MHSWKDLEAGTGSTTRPAENVVAIDTAKYAVVEEQMKLLMDKVKCLKQQNKALKSASKVMTTLVINVEIHIIERLSAQHSFYCLGVKSNLFVRHF